jgi:diadenosine tetraphosphate (Ap4A) HIT family hydrolase
VEPDKKWAEDWDARKSGASCGMCDDLDADEKLHGIRVLSGRWTDAYLGRFPVRPGYVYVIWKGRHVSEPTELTYEESVGFWSEVTFVATAVEERYKPLKMNWLSLGNGIPHLHVHLVPRYLEDSQAGGPIESDAFDQAVTRPISEDELRSEATALRQRLTRR